jgi:hypothetical protein
VIPEGEVRGQLPKRRNERFIELSQMASTRIVWWDWEQQESVDDRHWSS